MKIIHCEGKYDYKYLNRLCSFYNISNLVVIIPYNGKAQVINKIPRIIVDEFFVLDFDNGLNSRVINKIEKYPNNIIILKKDMEDFFYSLSGNDIGKQEKSKFADEFSNLTDEELAELLDQISLKSQFDIVSTEKQSCSNLLLILQEISN